MKADIFLAMKYERMIMFLDEVAHEIGIVPGSARNQISAGEFPIATRKQGNRLIADVRDVGKYLDDCRDEAIRQHQADPATPPRKRAVRST